MYRTEIQRKNAYTQRPKSNPILNDESFWRKWKWHQMTALKVFLWQSPAWFICATFQTEILLWTVVWFYSIFWRRCLRLLLCCCCYCCWYCWPVHLFLSHCQCTRRKTFSICQLFISHGRIDLELSLFVFGDWVCECVFVRQKTNKKYRNVQIHLLHYKLYKYPHKININIVYTRYGCVEMVE